MERSNDCQHPRCHCIAWQCDLAPPNAQLSDALKQKLFEDGLIDICIPDLLTHPLDDDTLLMRVLGCSGSQRANKNECNFHEWICILSDKMTLYSCECSAALAVREQTKINATSMDEYAFYQTSRADYCSDRPSLPLGELCLILEHVSEMNGEVSNKPSTVPGASTDHVIHMSPVPFASQGCSQQPRKPLYYKGCCLRMADGEYRDFRSVRCC
jgi:hypothetical protein